MTNKGQISEKEISDLKQLYPKEALFKFPSPNKKDDIVFRAISMELMQKIVSIIRDSEIQGRGLPIQDVNEKLFESCVLWPVLSIDEKRNLPVGTIPSVVKSIQEKSGFIDIDIFQRVLAPDTYTTILKDFETWGDISEEEAEELKKECKQFTLFRIRVGKWVFIIRPMTRVDIQIASQSNDDQLTLARAVTMWPKQVEWETIPAGIIEILGQKANEVSGWNSDSECEEL